jgi:hypothetical protein
VKRRAAIVVAALLLAGAGVFLLLLAVDVRRWQGAIAAGDATLRAQPAAKRLWQPSQLVPGSLARDLLGLGDDVRAREAIQLVALGRPRQLAFVAGEQAVAYRSAAQTLLGRLAGEDANPVRRAQELNLLGVVELITAAAGDPLAQQQHLPRAADDFRRAILVDPTSADAKHNLELTLRLLRPSNSRTKPRSGLGGVTARGEGGGSGY